MIGLKATMNVSPPPNASVFESKLTSQVIDNSGGLIAECINVLKAKSSHGMAAVGECAIDTS